MRRKADTELDSTPSKRPKTTDSKDAKPEKKHYTRHAILADYSQSLLQEVEQKGKNFTPSLFEKHIEQILKEDPFETNMFSRMTEFRQDKSEQICRLLVCDIPESKQTLFSFIIRNKRWDLINSLIKIFQTNKVILVLIAYLAANSLEDNEKELNEFIKYYYDGSMNKRAVPLKQFNCAHGSSFLSSMTKEFFIKKWIGDNSSSQANVNLPQKLALLMKYKLYEYNIICFDHYQNLEFPWSVPTFELILQNSQTYPDLRSLFENEAFFMFSLPRALLVDLKTNPHTFSLFQLFIKYQLLPKAAQLFLDTAKEDHENFIKTLTTLTSKEIEHWKKQFKLPCLIELTAFDNEIRFVTKIYNQIKEHHPALLNESFFQFFGPLELPVKSSLKVSLEFLETSISILEKLSTKTLSNLNPSDFYNKWFNWCTYLKEHKIDITKENGLAQRFLTEFLKHHLPPIDLFEINENLNPYDSLRLMSYYHFCNIPILNAFFQGLQRHKRMNNYLLSNIITHLPKLTLKDLNTFSPFITEETLILTFDRILNQHNETRLILFLDFIKDHHANWLKKPENFVLAGYHLFNKFEYLIYFNNRPKHRNQLTDTLEFLNKHFPNEMKAAHYNFQKEFQHLDHEGVYRGKDNKQLALIASALKTKYHSEEDSSLKDLLQELKSKENEVKYSILQKQNLKMDIETELEALDTILPQVLMRQVETKDNTPSRETKLYELFRNHKICIARRCALMLSTLPLFTQYEEPTSGVTIPQALSYIYDAIFDDDNFPNDEHKDRFNILIDVLCEIGRTYNMQADGKDNHLSDSPSCAATSLSRLLRVMALPRADGSTVPGMVQIVALTKSTAWRFYADFCLLQFGVLEEKAKTTLIEQVADQCAKETFNADLIIPKAIMEFILHAKRVKEFREIHDDYFADPENLKRFLEDLDNFKEWSFKETFYDIYQECRKCWQKKYAPTSTGTTSSVYMSDVQDGKDSKESKQSEFKLFGSSTSSSSSSQSSSSTALSKTL